MSKMKYRDLQRNAIVRGMGFSEMVNSDIYSLQAWLAANWKIPIDTQKLDEFDYWREKFLYARGYVNEPFVRLGYIGKVDENGEVVSRKRVKGMKKNRRPRRDKNALGIFTGTKKDYTYQCYAKKIPLEKAVGKIMDKYPDANEKSIRIWYRQFKRRDTSK